MRKTRILNVWDDDGHEIGTFVQRKRTITFEYAPGAPRTPISLSLPREGGWNEQAPEAFLENLLPENSGARFAMMRAQGGKSTDAFSLLDGVDSTGGLVFSSEDHKPTPAATPVVRAEEDDIAARIAAVENSPVSWFHRDPDARFSLAGAQGKFAAARVADTWFWSNAILPSTHLFKPDSRSFPGIMDLENAGMTLAMLCGIDTPSHGIETFSGKSTYIIERFDRAIDGTGIRRLRCEDLLQALGLLPEDKYKPTARDCLDLLARIDPDQGMRLEWVRRLMFGVHTGNSDMHAKNTSVMPMEDGSWRLTPVYDQLTVNALPDVGHTLAMPINGVDRSEQVSRDDWMRFADRNGLDSDRISRMLDETVASILSHLPEAAALIGDDDLRARYEKTVLRSTGSARIA